MPALAIIGSDDTGKRTMHRRREDSAVMKGVVVSPRQHDRIRQRVDLPLSLPDPVIAAKRVGVRIDRDIARIALDDAADERLEARPVACQTNVRQCLCRRISQPHGGDVARLDVRRPVGSREKVRRERVKKSNRRHHDRDPGHPPGTQRFGAPRSSEHQKARQQEAGKRAGKSRSYRFRDDGTMES